MIEVKILVGCAGDAFAFSAGEVVSVPGTLAEDLIRGGLAELVAKKQSERAENAASKQAEKAEKR